MLYITQKGESFDTDKDLSAAERHVLQKLLIWRDFAASVAQFRQKKLEALHQGWDHTGPIPESRALQRITQDLEETVALRILAPEKP